MNFKTYLKESLQDQTVYEFYVLEYIITAGNTETLEKWERERLQKLHRNISNIL